jgi:hypothetical protein
MSGEESQPQIRKLHKNILCTDNQFLDRLLFFRNANGEVSLPGGDVTKMDDDYGQGIGYLDCQLAAHYLSQLGQVAGTAFNEGLKRAYAKDMQAYHQEQFPSHDVDCILYLSEIYEMDDLDGFVTELNSLLTCSDLSVHTVKLGEIRFFMDKKLYEGHSQPRLRLPEGGGCNECYGKRSGCFACNPQRWKGILVEDRSDALIESSHTEPGVKLTLKEFFAPYAFTGRGREVGVGPYGVGHQVLSQTPEPSGSHLTGSLWEHLRHIATRYDDE